MKYLDLNSINARAIPGTESIAIQDGSYGRETTALVGQLRGGYINHAGFANAFAKITEKHTCIWVTLTFEENYHNAHIFPSWLCSANALAGPEYRHYEQFTRMGFNSKDKPLIAYINDKTSKVGGFLKDIENKMAICKSYFENKDFSDESVASVLIHEVGHAYTFFQYSIRTVVFNAALSQASQNLSKARSYEEVKIIFKETCDLLDINDRTFIEELKNTQNRVTQFTYLASNMAKSFETLPSMDVSKGFSQDAAEVLADIFAARHGCERGTMGKRAYYELRENNSWIMKSAMITFAKIAGGTALGIADGGAGATLPFIYSLFNVGKLILFIERIGSINGITTAHQQVKKMQNQLIERLKAAKLKDVELIKMIDESLAYGDQLLAQLSQNDSMFFTLLGFLKSDIRNARAMRFYQDQLEGLAANRLFLSASKFGV